MNENEIDEELDGTLWVLARLKESIYALNGKQVESILVMDEDIIKLPDSNDIYRGTILFRGGVIPVLDLRCLIGMESHEEEQNRFEQMLEDRKQDHIRWVDALQNSVNNGIPFQLATDPHKCAFGKWYDHYEPSNQTVAFHLKKIDEPHRNLHRMATSALACKQEHSTCKRTECLKDSLKKATDLYMPRVVHLLEEAKQIFRDSYRKMVIIVSHGESIYGILVDEVLSAEPLGPMKENCKLPDSKEETLISHISARKGSTENILVLDLNRLFEIHL